MDHPANATELPDAAKPRRPIAGRRTGAVVLFILVTLISLTADLGLKTYTFNQVADFVDQNNARLIDIES